MAAFGIEVTDSIERVSPTDLRQPMLDRPPLKAAAILDLPASVLVSSNSVNAPPTANNCPTLTVIIPVFNEAGTIDEVLRRVLAAPYAKQVLVVDDCSTDGTADVLAKWEGHSEVELLQHGRNRGKGAAIRTGLEQARGEVTIIQDADLEYDPQDFSRVIEPLLRGEAQVVYGSRYRRESRGEGREIADRGRPLTPDPSSPRGRGANEVAADRPRVRRGVFDFGVRVLNWAVRILYGVRITDEATCYKAFPTDILRAMDLQCERFEFCPEVTAKACRMGLTIHEVRIHYSPRSVAEGKKIRWTDGVEALRTLWRWRQWRPSSVRLRSPLETAVRGPHASAEAFVARRVTT